MDSYEQRLKTFENKNWFNSKKAYTPETLAICGFYAEKKSMIMAVKCYLCKKTLEGWDDDEIPIVEHYNHKKTCIIFKPNIIKSRRTLLGNIPSSDDLARKNFIKYNISKDKPFIFCFKCGSQDTDHTCQVKTQGFKFTPGEESEFFFANLISGRFSQLVSDMMSNKAEISDLAREALEPLLDELEQFDPSKTLGEFIDSYCEAKLKIVRDKMDNDLKDALKQ